MSADLRVGLVGTQAVGSDRYGFVVTRIMRVFKSGRNKGTPREIEICFVTSDGQRGPKEVLSYRPATKRWNALREKQQRYITYTFGSMVNRLDPGF